VCVANGIAVSDLIQTVSLFQGACNGVKAVIFDMYSALPKECPSNERKEQNKEIVGRARRFQNIVNTPLGVVRSYLRRARRSRSVPRLVQSN